MPLSNWQCSIDGFVMGAGTVYRLGPDVLEGIDSAPPKSRDFMLEGQDGSIGAGDYRDVRFITIDLVIVRNNLTDAYTSARTLAGAWIPVNTPGGVAFNFKLPGDVERTCSGFPEFLRVDYGDNRRFGGVLAAIAQFRATSPAIVAA